MPVSLTPLLVGLLPPLVFLAALLLLDSYKLVRPGLVLAALGCGALAAGASWFVNGALLEWLQVELAPFSRYVAPVTEELLKALLIVLLIRSHRIGFLVDAAIVGFAVGAGFALVENVYFLRLAPDAALVTWIVRGFGTAVMHGGATALFAVVALTLLERQPHALARAVLPGLALAAVLHSAFNHFSHQPVWATVGVVAALPLLFNAIYLRSEQATRHWLGIGFDSDVTMLGLIASGDLPDSPVGRYLDALRHRVHGPVLADMLCYLRIYTELSLRAKGMLMMREHGFEAAPGADVRASLDELRYLERSIGATGLRTLRPLLRISHKDLWQLYALDGA